MNKTLKNVSIAAQIHTAIGHISNFHVMVFIGNICHYLSEFPWLKKGQKLQ